MNKYHIRIDGELSNDSYTYQEMVDMGLFNLDNDNLNGIEVKKVSNTVFKPLKSFYFPERQSKDSSYSVDEYGQIHRKIKSRNKNGASIDEYEPNNPSASSSTSLNSTSSSSISDGWDIFWRIIGIILFFALGILTVVYLEEGWGSVVFCVGCFILRSIWNWLDDWFPLLLIILIVVGGIGLFIYNNYGI